jgi:ABC-type branched-subunit amino acid transport system substrate-binding protein
MRKPGGRFVVSLVAVAAVAAACSSCGTSNARSAAKSGAVAKIDYKALGLWNDGPCDAAKAPLVVGLMTVFESPAISLKDQADALRASAKAFNARGGANGACIKVHTCDDGANLDQSVACVREIDHAGVVATINDEGTAGQTEVSAAMAKAGIPRIAANVTPYDWSDQNAYPLDASGTGVGFLMPQGLIDAGIKKIGIIRVSLAEASALVGLLEQLYKDEGATFPYDTPVAAGTTDYSQYILGAQQAGVDGVVLPVGVQEAVQISRAAQQLDSHLKISTGIGTRSFAKHLGDFAKQMIFVWPFAPPTVNDVPAYAALRQDLAASGSESLQPDNLQSPPMRSWIGLYALLRMIRDAHLTHFTRDSITEMLGRAKNVPMLGMFGSESWTPAENTPGAWKRKGIDRWTTWRWDPSATFDGDQGNFVLASTISFSAVLCGSPFGAPAPCPPSNGAS